MPKPVVLIGFLNRGQTGPIPTITAAFMQGLGDRYRFVAHVANRKYGATLQAALNPINGYYFLKHLLSWIALLIVRSPDIAHYPVTSFWNLEKSLVFLRVARFFRARTVGHLHGGAFMDFWRDLTPLRKKHALRQLRRLDAFVVLSDGWKRRIETEVGLDSGKVFVVSNPIDQEFEEEVVRIPVPRMTETILSLGVMDQDKGVLDIVDAVEGLLPRTGWHLALVGPERQPGIRARVQERVEQRGLSAHVRLFPGVRGSEKITLFRDASLFLLPSYFENFPLVIIEAAAAGLPIITTPIGAVPEFFEDGKSILFVEPGNVPQIRDVLAALINDSDRRNALGSAAREVFIKRLSRKDIMRSLDDTYHYALSGKV